MSNWKRTWIWVWALWMPPYSVLYHRINSDLLSKTKHQSRCFFKTSEMNSRPERLFRLRNYPIPFFYLAIFRTCFQSQLILRKNECKAWNTKYRSYIRCQKVSSLDGMKWYAEVKTSICSGFQALNAVNAFRSSFRWSFVMERRNTLALIRFPSFVPVAQPKPEIFSSNSFRGSPKWVTWEWVCGWSLVAVMDMTT